VCVRDVSRRGRQTRGAPQFGPSLAAVAGARPTIAAAQAEAFDPDEVCRAGVELLWCTVALAVVDLTERSREVGRAGGGVHTRCAVSALRLPKSVRTPASRVASERLRAAASSVSHRFRKAAYQSCRTTCPRQTRWSTRAATSCAFFPARSARSARDARACSAAVLRPCEWERGGSQGGPEEQCSAVGWLAMASRLHRCQKSRHDPVTLLSTPRWICLRPLMHAVATQCIEGGDRGQGRPGRSSQGAVPEE